ncbi:hypothetical protein BZA70DRAFT_52578 [Myxozyma melibiosi]|uniref:Uncharacterized protein n=1 Tax=Myxozyma melibiosi TaxID=54550 RepID=A0ABR1FFY4_9ASCO
MLSRSALRQTARVGVAVAAKRVTPAVIRSSVCLKRGYADAKAGPTEVSSILEERIRGVSADTNLAETGRVLSVGLVLLQLSLIPSHSKLSSFAFCR